MRHGPHGSRLAYLDSKDQADLKASQEYAHHESHGSSPELRALITVVLALIRKTLEIAPSVQGSYKLGPRR